MNITINISEEIVLYNVWLLRDICRIMNRFQVIFAKQLYKFKEQRSFICVFHEYSKMQDTSKQNETRLPFLPCYKINICVRKQSLLTISLNTIHLHADEFSITLKQLCINASVRRCSTRNEKCMTS